MTMNKFSLKQEVTAWISLLVCGFILLCTCALVVKAQPTPTIRGIIFQSPSPSAVSGANLSLTGPPGLTARFYWVIANYPIGQSSPVGPLLARNSPDTLSVTNFITISWNGVQNATSYDVLRTTAPSLPSSSASLAVATGLTVTSVNDTGGALTSYTVAGVGPAQTQVYVENTRFSTPRLMMSDPLPIQLGALGLYFGDGTQQTTAGGGGSGMNQLTGDVTAGPGVGSQAATIQPQAVSFAKIQNINTSRVLGRTSGGAGSIEELTALTKALQHAATVYTDQANTYTAGMKQTFTPNATTAGVNDGSLAGDPSALSNGDRWYNSTTGKFKCREAGVTVDCIGAGGGGIIGGVNSQTGVTYTVVTGDDGKLVTRSNAGAMTDTVPQAGVGGFGSSWKVFYQNQGAGLLTINFSTSTFDGASTIDLSQGQGIVIYSNGTNYFSMRGWVGIGTGLTMTSGIITVNTAVIQSRAATQANSSTLCAPSGGSSTAYTCNLTPAITDYANLGCFEFDPDIDSTGSSQTLAINGLAAKTLQKVVAGILTNMAAGELESTAGAYKACYNGTTFTVNGLGFDAAGAVSSVFGRTGAVVAVEADYSLTLLSDVTAKNGNSTVVQMGSGTAGTRQGNVSFDDTGTTINITTEAQLEIKDEFISGSGAVSGLVGSLGWLFANMGTGTATSSRQASEAGRTGIFRISATGTADNDSGAFYLGNGANVDITDVTQYEWDAIWIFRPGSIADIHIIVGLVATTTTMTPTSGIFLSFDTDAADSVYGYKMVGAGTDSGATSIAPNTSNWVKFKLRRRTVGVGGNPTIYATVNDADEQTWCSSGCTFATTNIPTTGQKFVFAVQTRVIATAKTVDCDFFAYRQYGLTR